MTTKPAKTGAAKKSAAKVTATKTVSAHRTAATTQVPHRAAKTAKKAGGGRVPHAQERTGFLIDLFGGPTALADLLRVNKSQPSRWSRGQESPSPEKARHLLDLDHVMARATLVWGPDAAREWMVGSNALLDGARPIDVLRLRGSMEVIAALDAEDAGAFA